MPCKPAHQRNDDDQARGGGQKVLHRQRQHLREVAHGALAAVALPIGVGDKADGRVEGRVRRHGSHALRVERQHGLPTLQRIHGQHAQAVEHQQAQRVAQPAGFFVGPNTCQLEQWAFQPTPEGKAARHHRVDVTRQRPS